MKNTWGARTWNLLSFCLTIYCVGICGAFYGGYRVGQAASSTNSGLTASTYIVGLDNQIIPCILTQETTLAWVYTVYSEPCLVISLHIIIKNHGDDKNGYLVGIYQPFTREYV